MIIINTSVAVKVSRITTNKLFLAREQQLHLLLRDRPLQPLSILMIFTDLNAHLNEMNVKLQGSEKPI
jgi:hypothetical protein